MTEALFSGLVAGLTVLVVSFLARFGLEYYFHHTGTKSRFLTASGSFSNVTYRQWQEATLARKIRRVLYYMSPRL